MAKQTKNIDEYVAGLESKTSVTDNEYVLINDGGTNKSISASNLVSSGISQIESFDEEGRTSLEYLTEVGSIPIYNFEEEKTSLVGTFQLLSAFFNRGDILNVQSKLKGNYQWYDNKYNIHIDENAPVIFPNGIALSYSRDKNGDISDFCGLYLSGEKEKRLGASSLFVEDELKCDNILADSITTGGIELGESAYQDGNLIKIENTEGSSSEVYNTAGSYTEVYGKSEIDEKFSHNVSFSDSALKYISANGLFSEYNDTNLYFNSNALYLRISGDFAEFRQDFVRIGDSFFWVAGERSDIFTSDSTSGPRFRLNAPILLVDKTKDYIRVNNYESASRAFTTDGGCIDVYSKDEIDKMLKDLKESLTAK